MKNLKLLALFIGLGLLMTIASPSLFAQTHKTTRRKTVSTAPSLLHPASLHAKAPEVYLVKLHTTKGDFTMKVTRAWAPLGADRFYNLVEHHFYDGASLFRVVPKFVVQFGLPADPSIGRAWANANIKDDPVMKSNLTGYVTYAMGGPNTRTTQVFINLVDNTRLDSMGFAPFGQVVEGMEVVQQFYGGYGDHGPDQGRLTNEGKAYVEKNFPQLDTIITAHVAPTAPAAHPPAKPAPHS
ncbi:MAG TPA: peptidylprolyl isomerase [Candidatus Acidoferrales bacterium]|nr:peptidylprolyl isomerase [Candidatus Acidoferrales bacterium]